MTLLFAEWPHPNRPLPMVDLVQCAECTDRGEMAIYPKGWFDSMPHSLEEMQCFRITLCKRHFAAHPLVPDDCEIATLVLPAKTEKKPGFLAWSRQQPDSRLFRGDLESTLDILHHIVDSS